MQTFYNKEGKEIQRTQCQVYTRVKGYLRPVSHYNTGKKSEFYIQESILMKAKLLIHHSLDNFQIQIVHMTW